MEKTKEEIIIDQVVSFLESKGHTEFQLTEFAGPEVINTFQEDYIINLFVEYGSQCRKEGFEEGAKAAANDIASKL